MAVMLNMMPVSPKQNVVSKNATHKGNTSSDKSDAGFAKTLDVETDKNGVDVESKTKNEDNTQLMSALAGVVLPVLVKGNQVPGVTDDSLKSVAINAHAPLENAVAVVPQAPLGNVVPAVAQAQLGNIVPAAAAQAQLGNIVPAAAQAPLGNIVPAVAQAQLGNVVPAVAQAQLGNVVPTVPQTQLGNTVPAAPQTQLMSSGVPGVPQQAVPGVGQAQLVDVVSPEAISQTGSTVGMNTSQAQLATLLAKKTGMKAQLNTNQMGQFSELQAQAQLQMQSKPIPGQIAVTDVATKNTDMVTNNSVLPNHVALVTAIGNTGIWGKNSGKQLEDKKIVSPSVNADTTEVVSNLGKIGAVDVKNLLAPQVAVAVVNGPLSNNKETMDANSPTTIVKDPDAFASILTQQGMQIDNQTTPVEVKQGSSQPVSDSYNITSQIVDQARLVAGAKNTEMIIQLKPEHLGELTFKVTVENGIVSASFHSNNAEVRSIIESSLPQLKSELFNHGVKMDTIGVYAGLGQSFSNDQQTGGYQQPVIKVHNKKNEEEFLDILESKDSANRALDVNGVDYRA